MAHVVLYIAMSLDGRIAGPGDDVSWLEPYTDTHGSYDEFRASITGAVMGRASYEFARGYEPWVYPGLPVAVLTSRAIESPPPDVCAHTGPPTVLLDELEAQLGERVWLVGGGKTVAAFLAEDLIDEMRVFVMPVLLGEGPLLVSDVADARTRFDLSDTKRYESGVVELRYLRR